jgi:hypothetical protein
LLRAEDLGQAGQWQLAIIVPIFLYLHVHLILLFLYILYRLPSLIAPLG